MNDSKNGSFVLHWPTTEPCPHLSPLPLSNPLPHHSSLPQLVWFSHLSAAALGTHSHIVEDQVNRKIPYQPFVQYGGVF